MMFKPSGTSQLHVTVPLYVQAFLSDPYFYGTTGCFNW